MIVKNNRILDGDNFVISISGLPSFSSGDIEIIGNYFALNHYGITGYEFASVLVKKNIFIQKFSDSATRKYWTDTNNTLNDPYNEVTWEDNVYKEAFSQEVPGDNTNALQFVVYPKNGVVLP